MGNTLKSLAVAASLLAAAPDTPGQDQANVRATKTSAALTMLLNALPTEFVAGKKKIAGDIDLTTDGDLSPSDATTIERDMSLLAPKFPEVVRKVREAMNGVGTIVAVNEAAALNESPEEKKLRLEKEGQFKMLAKILKDLNRNFFDDKIWKVTNSKGAYCDIKITGSSIKTTFIDKNTTGATAKSTAYMQTLLLPGFTYEIEIEEIIGDGRIGIKLSDSSNKLTPLQVLQKGTNTVVVPDNYNNSAIFEIENTALDLAIEIKGFRINIDNENIVTLNK